MVQVDLEVLKQKWYDLGKEHLQPEDDNRTLFNELDAWQRKELLDSYAKGISDSSERWKK